jgi:hypothetical protein
MGAYIRCIARSDPREDVPAFDDWPGRQHASDVCQARFMVRGRRRVGMASTGCNEVRGCGIFEFRGHRATHRAGLNLDSQLIKAAGISSFVFARFGTSGLACFAGYRQYLWVGMQRGHA